MVTIFSSHSFLQNSCPQKRSTTDYPFRAVRIRIKPTRLTIFGARADVQKKEDIVIVGAGIAGLATAVSLHRLGIQSLVLEQAESQRTGGTSLTLFKNGWRVLDALGVGNELRTQFLEIQGMTIKAKDGRELRSFKFKEEDESQEVRAVERGILLESLANQLPADAIRFSSKLTQIEKSESGETLLQLMDGTQLSAKVTLILRSPYMSMAGPKITDPSVLKKQTCELVKNWPLELLNIIEVTPGDTIIRTPLVDRWLWPAISPSASAGRVVVVGDAWHPMTPNLGQGACCALEDAVVLAKKLAPAIKSGPTSVEDALKSYENKRWPRVFPLTIRANLVGTLLQLDNPLVCSVRNNVVVPKVVRLGPILEHTNFECEPI